MTTTMTTTTRRTRTRRRRRGRPSSQPRRRLSGPSACCQWRRGRRRSRRWRRRKQRAFSCSGPRARRPGARAGARADVPCAAQAARQGPAAGRADQPRLLRERGGGGLGGGAARCQVGGEAGAAVGGRGRAPGRGRGAEPAHLTGEQHRLQGRLSAPVRDGSTLQSRAARRSTRGRPVVGAGALAAGARPAEAVETHWLLRHGRGGSPRRRQGDGRSGQGGDSRSEGEAGEAGALTADTDDRDGYVEGLGCYGRRGRCAAAGGGAGLVPVVPPKLEHVLYHHPAARGRCGGASVARARCAIAGQPPHGRGASCRHPPARE
eukprot:scaffold125851_cov48-Phaeocystis_antarctica.AAC.1